MLCILHLLLLVSFRKSEGLARACLFSKSGYGSLAVLFSSSVPYIVQMFSFSLTCLCITLHYLKAPFLIAIPGTYEFKSPRNRILLSFLACALQCLPVPFHMLHMLHHCKFVYKLDPEGQYSAFLKYFV
jgi:hypothetical protein